MLTMRSFPPTSSYLGLILLLLALSAPAQAEKLPPIWGYGVQSCTAFLQAAEEKAQGREYQRYEDWLTGLITGLNLATGQDVLIGLNMKSALQRIQVHCQGHKEQDFFNAAMDLIRTISKLH